MLCLPLAALPSEYVQTLVRVFPHWPKRAGVSDALAVGSSRIPAAFNGLAALKTSEGRLSTSGTATIVSGCCLPNSDAKQMPQCHTVLTLDS